MPNPFYTFRNVNEALPVLANDLLRAPLRGSRNGDMREILTTQIRIEKPFEREVLVESRRASYPAQIAETMWVLAGRDDVDFLSHYLPRAKDFSDDGKVWAGGYGPRLRRWAREGQRHGSLPGGDGDTLDQLEHVVNLLRKDPDTRRAVIAIYDPSFDSAGGKDVPCNDFLQFIARDGVLHLSVFTRSNDVIWGWSGINQFEWSVLLEIVATLTGFEVGSITYNVTSLHLYAHHFGKAEKIAAESPNPKSDRYGALAFRPASNTVEWLDSLIDLWFDLEEDLRTASTDAERLAAMAGVRQYPEPLFRGWLLILADYWGVEPLGYVWIDTAQKEALKLTPRKTSPQPKESGSRVKSGPFDLQPFDLQPFSFPHHTDFSQKLSDLHAEKHAAYGDSWKRRGEFVAILANIARKVDRLGVAGGGDTAADTVIDLLIYLIKYRAWLTEFKEAPSRLFYPTNIAGLSDSPEVVDNHLRICAAAAFQSIDAAAADQFVKRLTSDFDELERKAEKGEVRRYELVDDMIDLAYPLARYLDWKEGNEERSWGGYDEADKEALTGD